MLRKNNNITMSLMTDSTVLESACPGNGVLVTSANLPKGAVVVVDKGMKRNTTAIASMTAGTEFMIVQGNGTNKPLLKSPILTAGRVSITSKKYVASKQQVTTIGYNGSTGSLPTSNNTSYFIKLRKNDNDGANQSQPSSLFAQFKTDASGTQAELAFGLAKNFNKNFADEPANGYAKAEVIGDGTVADFTGSATALLFTKGSTEVSFVDIERAASTGTVADGDVISIPSSAGTSFTFTAHVDGPHDVVIGDTVYTVADAGTAAQNATAIAAAINAGSQATATVATADVTIVMRSGVSAMPPVVTNNTGATDAYVTVTANTSTVVASKYKVDGAVTAGATFKLDRPYAGETGYVVGGTGVTVNTGIATVTNYGIQITGIEAPFDVNKFRNFYVNRFTVSFSDADTLVTHTQGAITGNGVWQQVAMDEYMTYGFEGQNEMIGVPPTSRYQFVKIPGNADYTIVDCKYSVVNINWTESINGLVTTAGSQGSVVCYLNLDAAANIDGTSNISESMGVQLAGVTGTGLDE